MFKKLTVLSKFVDDVFIEIKSHIIIKITIIKIVLHIHLIILFPFLSLLLFLVVWVFMHNLLIVFHIVELGGVNLNPLSL